MIKVEPEESDTHLTLTFILTMKYKLTNNLILQVRSNWRSPWKRRTNRPQHQTRGLFVVRQEHSTLLQRVAKEGAKHSQGIR